MVERLPDSEFLSYFGPRNSSQEYFSFFLFWKPGKILHADSEMLGFVCLTWFHKENGIFISKKRGLILTEVVSKVPGTYSFRMQWGNHLNPYPLKLPVFRKADIREKGSKPKGTLYILI